MEKEDVTDGIWDNNVFVLIVYLAVGQTGVSSFVLLYWRSGGWDTNLWYEEEERDQELVYPNNLTFNSPKEQEVYIRVWLKEKVGFNTDFKISLYPGKFQKERRSILPDADTSQFISSKDVDIAILEEPGHLNWKPRHLRTPPSKAAYAMQKVECFAETKIVKALLSLPDTNRPEKADKSLASDERASCASVKRCGLCVERRSFNGNAAAITFRLNYGDR
ncbi:hypothetical protein Tco_1483672 [Tanacetum coccineum]